MSFNARRSLTVTVSIFAMVGNSIAFAQTRQPGASYAGGSGSRTSGPAYIRTSQYIALRDGTRLAIDVMRPSTAPADARLPVVFEATPYHRARVLNGKLTTAVENNPTFNTLIQNGYIVASVDIRGRGASFGQVLGGGGSDPRDRWDMYDVIQWLASQPWSNGKVGQMGCSFVGNTTFWSAESMAPNLVAVAPSSNPLDSFDAMNVNGIRQEAFLGAWDLRMRQWDTIDLPPPVDEDKDGSLRAAAAREHAVTWDTNAAAIMPARKDRRFRDTPNSRPEYYYAPTDHYSYVPAMRTNSLPILQFGGWHDLFPHHSLSWLTSLQKQGVKQRLIIGPWWHCEWYKSDAYDTNGEHLRWFDRWLKGKDNGADKLPLITYYVVNAPDGQNWKSAYEWPLKNATRTAFYLGGKSDLTGASLNDGALGRTLARSPGADEYRVDYDVNVRGLGTRYRGMQKNNLSLSEIDPRSLTYTTAPFASATEVTGTPVMTLWASSTVADQDFYVYVSLVDEAGKTTLLTDGGLRASNRAIRPAPYDNQDLPWHGDLSVDQKPLVPGEPTKLEFALFPMSVWVRKGQRLRITLNNYDPDFDTPKIEPAPVVKIWHDRARPSSISLPLVR